MENDDPRPDQETEDPWDGPSPEEPQAKPEEEARKPHSQPGPNELLVVSKIEDYARNSRGPRIQVIKSRDIKNAEHFSEKVFRVLKSRGYSIEELNMETLKREPDDGSSSPKLVYSINEETIRQFLGANLTQSDKPMKYLFDNSMLAYIKAPVLISTVSDSFYDKVGLRSFTSEKKGATKNGEKRQKIAGTSTANKPAILSFYFASAAFALSALYSVFGNYLTFDQGSTVYTIVPFAILVLSVVAISARSFSLSREDRGSVALIVSSIVLFIMFLLFGILVSYNILSQNYWPNNLANALLNPSSVPIMILSAVIFALAVSRFTLFLGKTSGKVPYTLSIAGAILLVSAALTYNMPYITIFGQTVLSQTGPAILQYPLAIPVPMGHFTFNPSQPFFGTDTYYAVQGTSQYLLLRNWILFIANVLLSFSFILAIRSRKSASGKLEDY